MMTGEAAPSVGRGESHLQGDEFRLRTRHALYQLRPGLGSRGFFSTVRAGQLPGLSLPASFMVSGEPTPAEKEGTRAVFP